MSLSAKIDTPSFLLNSRNREEGTNTSFSFKLELKLGNDYNLVALTSATIPKTWNTINITNNTFVLDENGPTANIVIPTGNYNVCNFPKILSDLLNTASPNSWKYTVSYPDPFIQADTGKFTYNVSENSSVQPSFIFTSTGLDEIMGFEDNSTNLFVGDTLDSQLTINMQHTRFVTIKSSISNNFGNTDSDSAILARIPVEDIPDMGIVHYTLINVQDQAKAISNNRSNLYTFSLHDDRDRELIMDAEWMLQLFCWEHNRAAAVQIDRITAQVEKEEEEEEQKLQEAISKTEKKKKKEAQKKLKELQKEEGEIAEAK